MCIAMSPLFSVIIPFKNHLHTLSRLIHSIPNCSDVEVLLVDNQEVSIGYADLQAIGINRKVNLFHVDPTRFAGGACNEGLKYAKGRWLLFAGADDYFTDEAFEFFYSMSDSSADIVFSCMTGKNDITGDYSTRGEYYTKLIREYLYEDSPEEKIRFMFHSQCCKMFKKEFVEKHQLRFSEVKTGNDALFSVMAGYWAKQIAVADIISYVATVSDSNISRKHDYESVKCRYIEDLKINSFLRKHGYWRWQLPILETICHYGVRKRLQLLTLAFHYRQPLFVDYYTKAKY